MTRLRLDGITVQDSHGHTLLAPLDLGLEAGRTACLIGESGAGKSLVCAAIAGTLPPGLRAGGRIWLDGRDITDLPPAERRMLWSRHLFLLPQEPWSALAPARISSAQVGDMPRMYDQAAPWATATANLLQRVGLLPDRDGPKRPRQLSGGMAQRVAIATTLGAPAGLVLVDEPTKGLDAARLQQAEDGLRLLLGQSRSLLVVTHDLGLARRLGNEVLVMRDGQVIERGPAFMVLDQPAHAFTRALLDAEPERWPARGRAGTGALATTRGLSIQAERRGPVLAANLDLTMRMGAITGLFGPSGAGKTTLGDTLLGLRPQAAGRIEWSQPGRGQKLYQDPGAVFAPWRPIRATLSDALSAQGQRRSALGSAAGPMLTRLSLSPALLDRLPGAVSGGELQRLSLVRALLCRPNFIFADEATSRLDAISQRAMAAVLCDTAAAGTAILMASHNRTLLDRLAQDTVVLGEP